MNIPTTIPVTVSPEVEAHVTGLGMQDEFERLLERVQQAIPGLQRISVVLEPPYDTGHEDAVVIDAFQDSASYTVANPAWWQWNQWVMDTFSPDVYRHFTLMLHKGPDHGG